MSERYIRSVSAMLFDGDTREQILAREEEIKEWVNSIVKDDYGTVIGDGDYGGLFARTSKYMGMEKVKLGTYIILNKQGFVELVDKDKFEIEYAQQKTND